MELFAEEKDKKKEEEKKEEWKTPEERRNAFREDRDIHYYIHFL